MILLLKKYAIACVVLLICAKTVEAQSGSLQVVHSKAIERLLEQHIEYNSTHAISGFRIRIFRDNNASARQKANEARERFTRLFPGIRTYLSYDNPYFKVTAGDFRTRDDALSALYRIKRNFPKAFIVAEHIRFPALYEAEEEE
jgi:hypothetical protein